MDIVLAAKARAISAQRRARRLYEMTPQDKCRQAATAAAYLVARRLTAVYLVLESAQPR